MEVVLKKLEELKPYENNPRQNDEAVAPVAESIRQFGFKVPIIVDKNNIIVTGHTRFKAAKLLGLKEVPVIVADDLDEEKIKAFRIADNKVGEQADWDFDKLKIEIKDLDNFDWADFGFSEFELDVINDTVFDTIDDHLKDLEEATDQFAKSVEENIKKEEQPKQDKQSTQEPQQLNVAEQKFGKIQCPCCGELFDFDPGMIRGD